MDEITNLHRNTYRLHGFIKDNNIEFSPDGHYMYRTGHINGDILFDKDKAYTVELKEVKLTKAQRQYLDRIRNAEVIARKAKAASVTDRERVNKILGIRSFHEHI